ncbi:MAG: UDP-N-acetylmuramoyl-L-alanine--D-glutamate ligase [Verrucomicrobia bacterium]|nr:UDP-N-acetylmuramoyl-L-alanine--D-glutamate ligase [Verrucomicrobiota bacterium]
MDDLLNKRVLVIGLGLSGRAACRLLRRRGASVTAIDSGETDALRQEGGELRALGADVLLGADRAPSGAFDLAVVSPGVPAQSNAMREVARRNIPVIGELELGYQQAFCLNVAISGTNGKTTTTELVERLLRHCHRKTIAAGNIGRPLCDLVEQTRELDFLTLEVSSFQLETIRFFRPAVAVLLNITPDHLDRYASLADYALAKARLFENQQPFDWAIVQSEALAHLRSLGTTVPSKVVTFSANNRRADLYLDRGLLISRMEDWAGPLLDMEDCQLRGPHNAENLMAALAVGRVLRLPLEEMKEALKTYSPAPHRCELVAQMNGVCFVNDSKATNLDALQKALLAMPASRTGEPNILLIAGGKDKGLQYHDIGPLLAQRVKHAYLLGETQQKIRAAWSLFTPCTPVDSLLEAVSKAFECAISGDVVLLSPACSSFDMFQSYAHRGEVFRQAVERVTQSSHGIGTGGNPSAPLNPTNSVSEANESSASKLSPRSFHEGKLSGQPISLKPSSTERSSALRCHEHA